MSNWFLVSRLIYMYVCIYVCMYAYILFTTVCPLNWMRSFLIPRHFYFFQSVSYMVCKVWVALDNSLNYLLQCLEDIYEHHILEPSCESSENAASSPLLLHQSSDPWCRVIIFLYFVYLQVTLTFGNISSIFINHN